MRSGQFGLIAVEAVGQQIVAQCHQHTQRISIAGNSRFANSMYDANSKRTQTHLPFAVDPIGDQCAQQRPDGVGDRDDERVFETPGHLDALGDLQGRDPLGKTVIPECLKEVEDR
jgi:hypothetical protein